MPNLLTRFVRLLAWLVMAYIACLVVLLGWPASGWVAVIVAAIAWRFRRRARPTDLGSARWADAGDLAAAGMLGGGRGVILGRMPTAASRLSRLAGQSGPFVRNPHAVHSLFCGPTGSGKGVSFVIPTLLTNPDSCVVLDYKGELARATAAHRAKHFGHRVVLLDPYRSVTNTPDTLNPVDFIAKAQANGDAQLPDDASGKGFDESCADNVKLVTCPHCGKEFPE